ncbi:MAG: hypothetical protein H7327_09910, partial [Herminiimonas sp.]|nr:hypothetical protein [Herminiimonas sp.]
MKPTLREVSPSVLRTLGDASMPLKLSAAVTMAALIIGSAFQGAHAASPN